MEFQKDCVYCLVCCVLARMAASDDVEHQKSAQRRLGDNSSASNAASVDRDDDELSIPRAALNKMIKEVVPNVRVANDARELILACCTEFIHVLSSEANDVCERQQKKTISPEHILAALDNLGFSCYKDEAQMVLQEAKAVAAQKRRASTKLENLGIPEEELLRQQQELFAKARLEQALLEQQELQRVQQQLQQQQPQMLPVPASNTDDDDDYN